MTPLFVYKRGRSYLVRELEGKADPPPEDYRLVTSIDARIWLQCYLNYERKDRARMVRELEKEEFI